MRKPARVSFVMRALHMSTTVRLFDATSYVVALSMVGIGGCKMKTVVEFASGRKLPGGDAG